MPQFTSLFVLLLSSLVIISPLATPSFNDLSFTFERRTTEPYFPAEPPSCPLCAADYPKINHCAAACPVLANFTMVIFNPGAFIDVIQCACTETFQSVYPQCVDCFLRTGQEDVLMGKDLPSVVDGMRKVCAVASTLLGGAVTANGEITPTTSLARPRPTSSAIAVTQDGIFVGGIAMLLFTFTLIITCELVM